MIPVPLTRRRLLIGGAIVFAGLAMPGSIRLAFADAPTERRFVLIILRGALDGLAAVPPYADPDYASLRGALAFGKPGEQAGALDLDGRFGLNPALAPLLPMWQARELTVLHAAATPYRDRSHFDGQNLLENGTQRPNGAPDGWLNRALATLGNGDRRLGLAVGEVVPLVLTGGTPVASWEPAGLLPEASPDFLAQLASLYRTDPLLGPALSNGIDAQRLSDEVMSSGTDGLAMGGGMAVATTAADPGNGPNPKLRPANLMAQAAEGAGKLLADARGPRIAVLEAGGWDTHANQGLMTGRLATALGGLADGMVALKRGLGTAWSETVVVVVTEFGRTAAPNGTGGTDHGTGTVALLAGGRVAGGRVITAWPGLSPDKLYQGRDLAPTLDLRGPLKAALAAQFDIDEATLSQRVFPD
ncbi:MAG: DUF1501 domain-containing protein, partial [Hypericibacter sp.]